MKRKKQNFEFNFSELNFKKYLKKFIKTKPKFISYIFTLVSWLGNCLCKNNSQELHYVYAVTDKILTILESRGKAETIKYCKDLRRSFLEHILSMDEEFQPGVQSSFPKFFKPIMVRIQNSKSYSFIRLIFSALYISRFIKLEPKPSFASIEKGIGYTGNASDLREPMFRFLKKLGVNTRHGLGRKPSHLNFKEFHMTSKSGPNGHALWTSYVDYESLSEKQKQSLKIVGGDRLSDLADRFYQLYLRIPAYFDVHRTRKGTNATRRLVVIPDKEGKSREVAILDYWSQAALLPLHNFLFKQLSRISQDCTENQTKLFKDLRARHGNSFHSVDLTTATDRFPIAIQKELLSLWFGVEYASAWEYLMVGEPFTFKGKQITYQTGNPMGAYSSWAAFAMCHHFFVYLACERAGCNWKRCPYMLLGDDIVIAHDGVAKEYKNLLTEWDVPYSEAKTHTSKYGFEFAKQVRLHDVNISPFPLSALIERRSESFTILSIITSEIWYKDWKVELLPILKDYYINCLKWPINKWDHHSSEINLVISLLSFLQGRSSLGTAVRQYVSDHFGSQYATLTNWDFDVYSQFLALKVIQKTYLESMERISNKADTRPLGQLAVEMVMAITSLRDGGADCFDLIEAVPFLQIYGRAEETYLLLQADISIYTIGESPKTFRGLLGKVDIPLADEAFYVRHRDILLNQCLRSAKMMIEMIKSVPGIQEPRIGVHIAFPWMMEIKEPRFLDFPKVMGSK